MAGEICPVRQDGNQTSGIYAAIARVRPALFAAGKTVPEKALTISGADRFTRRGGTCRLHAIFMNQLCMNWGIRRIVKRGAPPTPLTGQISNVRGI